MSSLIGKSSGATKGLSGTGYKSASMQQFTPEQMKLFKGLFSQVGPDSYLGKLAGGDENTFNQLEAPAMKQFGQLQSGIANRFSGAGLGGRHSSGFQNAQNTAASDFASQLQSQRMGLQRSAINDLMRNSSELLGQRPQENFLLYPEQKKKSSFWDNLLGIGLPAAGAVAGGIFGGPGGAMMGGQIGSSAAQGFRGGQ